MRTRREPVTDPADADRPVVRQEIALYATKEADRGLTTSDYAARVGAQLAINGDSFAVNGYVPRGLAMGDSSTWTNTADDARSAVFHLRRVGERMYATISGR